MASAKGGYSDTNSYRNGYTNSDPNRDSASDLNAVGNPEAYTDAATSPSLHCGKGKS